MSNIQVACRVRPLNTKEIEINSNQVFQFHDEASLSIQISSGQIEQDIQHSFSYDHVFSPETKQHKIFEKVGQPLVTHLLQGFNSTLLVYGQTSSGKTYTMVGDDKQEIGLVPRTIAETPEHIEFRLKVSIYEIYQEKIKDLLDPQANLKSDLKVREDQQQGFYVQNLSHRYVSDEVETLMIMRESLKNRQVGITNMNDKSSRSHLIFHLFVNITNSQEQSSLNGQLMMVDLAGSECVGKTGVVGKGLQEAQSINKSLSTLAGVINALTDKSVSHIPYRDSQLTKLLRNGLGGNSQTTLIITCSPASYNYTESLSTLRFGARAKFIKNKPKINKEVTIQELKIQIQKLELQMGEKEELIKRIQTNQQNNQNESKLLAENISKDSLINQLQQILAQSGEDNKDLELNQKKLIDQNQQILEENSNLHFQIQQLQLKLNLINDSETVLRQENQQQKQEIIRLIETITKCEANLEQLEERVKQLPSEIQNAQSTDENYQAVKAIEIDILQINLQKLNNQIQFQCLQIRKQQEQNNILQQENQELKQHVQQMVSVESERVYELKQVNNQLTENLKTLQKDLAQTDLKLIATQECLENRVQKVVKLEELKFDLEQQQEYLMGFLQGDSKLLYKENQELRQKFDQLSILYHQATAYQQQIKSSSEINRKKLQQKSERIQQLEQANFTLRKQIQQLKQQKQDSDYSSQNHSLEQSQIQNLDLIMRSEVPYKKSLNNVQKYVNKRSELQQNEKL